MSVKSKSVDIDSIDSEISGAPNHFKISIALPQSFWLNAKQPANFIGNN